MTAPSLPVDFLARLRAVRKLLVERCVTVESGRRAAGLLQRIETRVQRPPRIVLLGETNSGKSTLANHLLQRALLTTDIVRNTRAPVLVRYAPVPFVQARTPDGAPHLLTTHAATRPRLDEIERIEVGVPIEALRDFEILDLQGLTTDTADVDRARRLCATAHMAIWCTVASQAWRASELALWTALSKRFSQSSVLAVTHVDGLSATDREKVSRRLERTAGPKFRSIVLVPENAAPVVDTAADHPKDSACIDTAPEPDFRDVVRAAAADIQAERHKSAGRVVRKFAERLTHGARERRATPGSIDETAAQA